jgi:hypothetical protein
VCGGGGGGAHVQWLAPSTEHLVMALSMKLFGIICDYLETSHTVLQKLDSDLSRSVIWMRYSFLSPEKFEL